MWRNHQQKSTCILMYGKSEPNVKCIYILLSNIFTVRHLGLYLEYEFCTGETGGHSTKIKAATLHRFQSGA